MTRNDLSLLHKEVCTLSKARFLMTRKFIQHGKTSVYRHSISVAYTSCCLAHFFHIPTRTREMIRGALLHDYFLYDWHLPNKKHRFHGITHPKTALKNACQDFHLTTLEKEIISRHMFPITPLPPTHREGWLIILADKICMLKEVFTC